MICRWIPRVGDYVYCFLPNVDVYPTRDHYTISTVKTDITYWFYFFEFTTFILTKLLREGNLFAKKSTFLLKVGFNVKVS